MIKNLPSKPQRSFTVSLGLPGPFYKQRECGTQLGDARKKCFVIAFDLDSLGRHQRHCTCQGREWRFQDDKFNKSQKHSDDIVHREMTTGKEEWKSLNLDEQNHAVLCPVTKQYRLDNLKKISIITCVVKCSFIAVFKLWVQCADNLFFSLLL